MWNLNWLLTGTISYTLNSVLSWCVWCERCSQKRRLSLCFTFDCLCETVHISWDSSSPSCQKFKAWQIAHSRHKIMYRHPHQVTSYSLWTIELLFAHFRQNPKCAQHSNREHKKLRELSIPAQFTGNNHHKKRTKMTELHSVEQHDLSTLNGE